MDEWIVLFRDKTGKPVAMQDRCLHRSARLSKGHVEDGKISCPYHGWTYDSNGEVIAIPSETEVGRKRCAVKYNVLEQDDYIYVQLKESSVVPFKMPRYKEPGYMTIRLQNTFENTVTNCVENFLDIPHTTYVHPTIFRNASRQKMGAVVERSKGHVKVTYLEEKSDFGIFSWFLNPKKENVGHTDEYFMPNVSTVNYYFGKKHFIITSQSIPVDAKTTKVYTDLTYNYGLWNWISKPIIRWQGQAIIDQDIVILKNQSETIQKYGQQFQNSPCDIIHTYIESIRNEIENGRDPMALAEKTERIEFWV
jgi:phenylpropionate dioxygenase-like ring-hydroxylating dioxygenase large terminal subunit